MSYNEKLLRQLEGLLGWKKSKKFYAEKLNVTEQEVDELIKEIRNREKDEGETFLKTSDSSDTFEFLKKVNNEKGTIESTITLDYEPKNHMELAELHKIDLDKYIITNYWSKGTSKRKVYFLSIFKEENTNRLYC